jgi:antirestriction protein ArdC
MKQNEMIAGKLAEQIQLGTSPFDVPGFKMPVNPTTGKSYRGVNALWLAMQERNDPRWMTLRQASNANGWKIETGSKGTLISFLKTQDRVQMINDDGTPKLNSRNNPVTQLMKLENPVETKAYVFNAEQIEGIPALEEYLADREAAQQLTPTEKLAKLVELSKVTIEPSTGDTGYDAVDRIIYIDEPEQFESPEHYNAALLFELLRAAGHEKELFDPMANTAVEEARPMIAALLLGSEIGVASQLATQLDRDVLLEVLENDPDQLEAIANDAQYIKDYVAGLDNQRGQRQGMRSERYLQVGDVIDYNEKQYEVMGKLPRKALQVQEKGTENEPGNRFRVTPGDGIYTSLLAAKNEQLKQQQQQAKVEEQEQVLGPEEELDQSIYHEAADELEHENDLQLNLEQEEGNERKNGMGR